MSAVTIQPPPPRVKKWTKEEYYDAVARGMFKGQRLFLFRGDLIVMSPQEHPHAFAVMRLAPWLTTTFELDAGYDVRIQLPLETPGPTVPEPDAVVGTCEQAVRKPHPCEALLVIEVADSSLALDREKAFEYAAARVPEYWIVDVNAKRLEVYRDPAPDPTARLGFRYASTKYVERHETIEPLAKPGAKLPLARLFSV